MAQIPQTQTKTQNTIIFIRRTVEWDGYELIDDEYLVVQPVMIINGDISGKYKRFSIDPKHKLVYVDLRVPKEVFRELLKAKAVKNVGAHITAWHWIPEKAVPILQKHGYKINEGWWKQYLKNQEANEKAKEKAKELAKKYNVDYEWWMWWVRNGILWFKKPHGNYILYNAHTDEMIETDNYELRDQLIEKYDPLNHVWLSEKW